MSDDQVYRVVESWSPDEWPYEVSVEELDRLNEIGPSDFSYVLWSAYGCTRIELYEYLGEHDVEDL